MVLSNNGHAPVPLLGGELGMCVGAIGPGGSSGGVRWGWLGGDGGQRAELKLLLLPPWISLGKSVFTWECDGNVNPAVSGAVEGGVCGEGGILLTALLKVEVETSGTQP